MERIVLDVSYDGEILEEHIFLYNCYVIGDPDIIEKYMLSSSNVTSKRGRGTKTSFTSLEFRSSGETLVLNLLDETTYDAHALIVVEDFTKENNVRKVLDFYMHMGHRFDGVKVALGILSGDKKDSLSTKDFLCIDDKSVCVDIGNDSLKEVAKFVHQQSRGEKTFQESYEANIKKMLHYVQYGGDEPDYGPSTRDIIIAKLVEIREVLKRLYDNGIFDIYAYLTFKYRENNRKINANVMFQQLGMESPRGFDARKAKELRRKLDPWERLRKEREQHARRLEEEREEERRREQQNAFIVEARERFRRLITNDE